MTKEKTISATQLAKRLGIPLNQLVGKLVQLGYVEQDGDDRVLTAAGEAAGGVYVDSKQFGRYIAWPESLSIDAAAQEEMLSATSLGENFELPARRINQILSEHGWIKKHLKGWLVTPLGQAVGGVQREAVQSGVPYVVWPKSVLENKTFLDTIRELKGEHTEEIKDGPNPSDKTAGFRDKFVPKLRTADGHFVRSRAEMLIDNWLYTTELVHAYERRLPIEEEIYCDFYLPAGKVYLEFWGMESDPKYRERKAQKIDIYKKYGLNLIELRDDDISNLDDVLPRLLLKHGITTY